MQSTNFKSYENWKNYGLKALSGALFEGTQMQICNSSYMFVFIYRLYPESFAFLILWIPEFFTRKVWKMFVYKCTETIE